jgi:hypothetical protein
MRPDASILLLTTSTGLGYGLLAWLGADAALGLLPAGRTFAAAGIAVALACASIGLMASAYHLGRKERAWRAFSQWRSSWLSREAVAALATYPVAIAFGLVVLAASGRAALAQAVRIGSPMARRRGAAGSERPWRGRLAPLRLILLGHDELASVVFWASLVGVGGALASVVFREAIALYIRVFTGYWPQAEHGSGLVAVALKLPWWHRAINPVVGGALAGATLLLLKRRFVSSQAADYLEAVRVADGRIGFRGSIVKSVGSLFTIASGGSIGREGSMVQLAAMVGSRVGLLARAPVPRLRLMVACGVAAGIAAAYNTPISGALFASEIVLGSMSLESFGPLVISSVVSNATLHAVLHIGSVYEVPRLTFASNWELILYVLLGALFGHLAPAFMALLDYSKSRFGSLDHRPQRAWGLPSASSRALAGCRSRPARAARVSAMKNR